ncbi:MAG: hypothetical protein NTX11_00190 [Candidatus Saccharibacteria bacterium]|nr:hypothetical protein [Candidatus Saccharibacteria bacterium]
MKQKWLIFGLLAFFGRGTWNKQLANCCHALRSLRSLIVVDPSTNKQKSPSDG